MGLRVRLALIQLVDGAPVGQGDLPVTIPLSLGLSGSACVGSDAGAPVMTDWDVPFARRVVNAKFGRLYWQNRKSVL